MWYKQQKNDIDPGAPVAEVLNCSECGFTVLIHNEDHSYGMAMKPNCPYCYEGLDILIGTIKEIERELGTSHSDWEHY